MWPLEENGRGGGNRWGRGFFYSPTPLHVPPDRGGERGWKNGGVETRSHSCNCSDARIFASRVAAARASLHARLLAQQSLARAGRGRRVHVLDARIGGSGSCIF